MPRHKYYDIPNLPWVWSYHDGDYHNGESFYKVGWMSRVRLLVTKRNRKFYTPDGVEHKTLTAAVEHFAKPFGERAGKGEDIS